MMTDCLFLYFLNFLIFKFKNFLKDLTVTALLAVFWMFGTLFFSISARRIEEATKPENVNATLAAIDICGGRKCEYTSYSVHATLAIASVSLNLFFYSKYFSSMRVLLFYKTMNKFEPTVPLYVKPLTINRKF